MKKTYAMLNKNNENTIYRCKGIPLQTIDEHINSIKFINRETYEQLYKG